MPSFDDQALRCRSYESDVVIALSIFSWSLARYGGGYVEAKGDIDRGPKKHSGCGNLERTGSHYEVHWEYQ